VVLGSLNFDIFLKTPRFPEEGETIAASNKVFKAFGGKGANQAVAAARLALKPD
jgi:ribokinase